jgi:hypothetical protein
MSFDICLLTTVKRYVNIRLYAAFVLFVTCFAAVANAQYTEKAVYPGAPGLDRFATATAGDQLYVIAGETFDGVNFPLTNLVYRFDPVANTWTPRANLPVALSNHEACAMNGKIYVPGGYNGTNTPSATLYIYDIAGNSWTAGAPVTAGLLWPTVVCNAAANKLYVIGGYNLIAGVGTTYIYDAASNTWSTGASLPAGATRNGADGGLINGVIYMSGGADSAGAPSTTTYAYNIAGNSWTTVAPIPVGCLYGAAGVDKANRLWIVGGGFCSDASAVTGRTAIYVPGNNSWSAGPTLNEAVRHANGGFAGSGNALFTVTGGYNGTSLIVNTQQTLGPTAAGVSITGRVLTSQGRGVTNALVTLTDATGNVFTAVTGRLGMFTFDTVPSGTSYVATVLSRRYSFSPRVVEVTDSVTGLDFTDSETGGVGRDDLKSEPRTVVQKRDN